MQVIIDGVEYVPKPPKHNPAKRLGDALMARRKELQMSLSKACADIGCSKSHLWHLEKSGAMPSLDLAARIATAYSIPITALADYAVGHNA